MNTFAKFPALTFFLTLIFLSACGGGNSNTNSESSSNPSVTNSTNPPEITTISNLPRDVLARDWIGSRSVSTASNSETSIDIIGSELQIKVNSDDLSVGNHVQIYLNTDNKVETGYQFSEQAWSESGVDYIIEDGDLFKSTSNNTNWDWNTNAGEISYSISSDHISMNIDLDLLGDICNVIKVGIMTRDDKWSIATFYPTSSRMQDFNVSYCNTNVLDTTPPILSLLGSNPLELHVGETINDPGVTAIDNIDGDISAQIEANSNINNSIAGNYKITYSATDHAGNIGQISRDVIVSEEIVEGIVIDGNTSDWSSIPTLSSTSNGILKVTDDVEKLYILVTSSNLGENIQVFLDADNSTDTGLDLGTQISTWSAGADYMIENNSLDKSTANSDLWAWDYGIAAIEYIKTSDALEIAIKKSDFNFLVNSIPIGYISRTIDWNVNYLLPELQLPVYTLQFPTVVNPVRANNDTGTTDNETSLILDVLANDISNNNSTLAINTLTASSYGSAIIVLGQIKYTPLSGFTGTDTFIYEVKDTNGNTDSAEVKVIVSATAPLNSPPVAVNDSFIVDIATQSSILLDVLANDSDPNGDSLTIVSVVEAPGGAYSVSSDNKILFIPSPIINEIAGIPYTISDGNGGTTTAKFTVNIIDSTNDNPVANDDLITTIQNQSVTFNVLENDTDADGDSITAGGIASGENLNGNVISNQNGSFTYTPNQGFVGLGTFTYGISDGRTGRARGTVKITVTAPTPNIPPIANDDFVTTDGINTLRIFVENNDSDPDGGGAGVDLNNDFTQPANGTVTRNTPHSLDYTPFPTFFWHGYIQLLRFRYKWSIRYCNRDSYCAS